MLITIRTVVVSVRPPLITLHRDSEEYDINVVMTCLEAFFNPSIHCGRAGFFPQRQPGQQRMPRIPRLSTLTLPTLSVFRMNYQGLAWTAFQLYEDIIQGDMCT